MLMTSSAAVQSIYLIFNEGCQRQEVKKVCEVLPHICIAVFPQALIVEAIPTVWLSFLFQFIHLHMDLHLIHHLNAACDLLKICVALKLKIYIFSALQEILISTEMAAILKGWRPCRPFYSASCIAYFAMQRKSIAFNCNREQWFEARGQDLRAHT